MSSILCKLALTDSSTELIEMLKSQQKKLTYFIWSFQNIPNIFWYLKKGGNLGVGGGGKKGGPINFQKTDLF